MIALTLHALIGSFAQWRVRNEKCNIYGVQLDYYYNEIRVFVAAK